MPQSKEALIKFDSNQCFHIFSRFLGRKLRKKDNKVMLIYSRLNKSAVP